MGNTASDKIPPTTESAIRARQRCQRGHSGALQQKGKRHQNDCRAGFANKDHRVTPARPKVLCRRVRCRAVPQPEWAQAAGIWLPVLIVLASLHPDSGKC